MDWLWDCSHVFAVTFVAGLAWGLLDLPGRLGWRDRIERYTPPPPARDVGDDAGARDRSIAKP